MSGSTQAGSCRSGSSSTSRQRTAAIPWGRGIARVLCIGDLHLGRDPAWAHEHAGSAGLDASEVSPAAALGRLCDHAIEAGVDAVVLAGDLVDDETTGYFPALQVLATSLGSLVEAGIDVVAVAGNHDAHVLPALARRIDGLVLLGPGGAWSDHVVHHGGEPALRLIGWSMPSSTHPDSPLASLPPEVAQRRFADGNELPVVAVMHAALGGSDGSYAPVRRSELTPAIADAWLLGHHHAADPLDTMEHPVGYLGICQPQDIGEPGWHGAWLLEADARGVRLERVQGAAAGYLRHEVDLAGCSRAIDALDRIGQSVSEALVAQLGPRGVDAAPAQGLAVVRLVLRGDVDDPAGLAAEVLASIRQEPPPVVASDGGWFAIADPTVEVRLGPAIDLAQRAEASDARGLLARLLLGRVDDADAPPVIRGVPEAERDLVEQAARELLARLEAQHRSTIGSDPA